VIAKEIVRRMARAKRSRDCERNCPQNGQSEAKS
jgi:hypothetical protein